MENQLYKINHALQCAEMRLMTIDAQKLSTIASNDDVITALKSAQAEVEKLRAAIASGLPTFGHDASKAEIETLTSDLPKFYELAELRLADLTPREKTINIKVSRNTAKMMSENEKYVFESMPELLAVCKELCAAVDLIKGPTNAFGEGTAVKNARAAIAKAEENQQ